MEAGLWYAPLPGRISATVVVGATAISRIAVCLRAEEASRKRLVPTPRRVAIMRRAVHAVLRRVYPETVESLRLAMASMGGPIGRTVVSGRVFGDPTCRPVVVVLRRL